MGIFRPCWLMTTAFQRAYSLAVGPLCHSFNYIKASITLIIWVSRSHFLHNSALLLRQSYFPRWPFFARSAENDRRGICEENRNEKNNNKKHKKLSISFFRGLVDAHISLSQRKQPHESLVTTLCVREKLSSRDSLFDRPQSNGRIDSPLSPPSLFLSRACLLHGWLNILCQTNPFISFPPCLELLQISLPIVFHRL